MANRITPKPGTRFGKFTVIDSESFSETKYRKKKALWLVRCDCGKECKILASNVKRGLSKSCGCLRKRTQESVLKDFYRGYKADAKRRGYSFRLKFEEFKKIVKKPCYYCGSEPNIRKFKIQNMEIQANGVDRVHNEIGYTLNNSVACCKVCNKMKMDLSYSEFMDKIELISNRSCGNDYNTRTTYICEKNTGDVGKVMLLCIYDLFEKFNLQKSEVKALINDLIDEHIVEEDMLENE